MEVKNGILLPVSFDATSYFFNFSDNGSLLRNVLFISSFELLLYARIFDSDDEHQLINKLIIKRKERGNYWLNAQMVLSGCVLKIGSSMLLDLFSNFFL